MYKKLYLFSIIIHCIQISAQDAFAKKLNFGGNSIIESYIFTEELDQKDNTQNEWKTNIDLNYQFSNTFKFKSSTQINLNVQEKGRRFIEPRELYFNIRYGKFNTSIGKQIINWSGLTGWSAADIPNTFQYYDFLDTVDEERGHWTLKSSLEHNNFQLSATIIPFFRVSKLFLENNRWINLPKERLIANSLIPLNFAGSNQVKTYDELQAGLKLKINVGNTQQILLAYHGYNDIPVRKINIEDQMPEDGLDYKIDLIYHKLQYLSWQSEFYFGQWNMWTEANVTKSRILKNETLEPHTFYNLILGTDTSFELSNPEQQFTFLLQYVYSFNTEDVDYIPTDLDHIFNNAILTRIRFNVNYKLKTEMHAAIEFKERGYYLSPKLEYTLFKDLNFLAGADILFGNRDSFFGYYQDNTRLRFALNYYF